MSSLRSFTGLLSTSIGRKLLIALTGIALIGFLIAHLLGNLLVFQGRDALNAYAAWLKSNPLLWVARAGLLAVFGLHVGLAVQLARENRAARPARYARGLAVRGTRRASRYMLVTGLMVFAFVVFHLLHFTLGVVEPASHALTDAQGRHDVYGMVVRGFSVPWIVLAYAAAMALLGLHLHHGVLSVLQTLGVGNPTWAPLARTAASALVVALIGGNFAIPLLVFLGVPGGAEVTS